MTNLNMEHPDREGVAEHRLVPLTAGRRSASALLAAATAFLILGVVACGQESAFEEQEADTAEQAVIPDAATTTTSRQTPTASFTSSSTTTDAPAQRVDLFPEALALTDPDGHWTLDDVVLRAGHFGYPCAAERIKASEDESNELRLTPKELPAWWQQVQQDLEIAGWEVATWRQEFDDAPLERWLLWAVKADHGVRIKSDLWFPERIPYIATTRRFFVADCIESDGLDLAILLPWGKLQSTTSDVSELPDYFK